MADLTALTAAVEATVPSTPRPRSSSAVHP
jgi:hypothetical protein